MSSQPATTAIAGRSLTGLLAFLIALLSPVAALAQTHPFIIVKSTDYPALQALSVGASSKVPFIRMRTDAMNISNTTTYSETAAVATRAGSMIKIMDSTALAYLMAPANRNTYRNRFYQYLKYWDLAQNGNITKDLFINDWGACVPTAAAFFATIIAMDIIYNDPSTTSAQITQRSNFNTMMEVAGTAGTQTPYVAGTMGAATFFKTQYEPYHLESLMSARALWALWKDGPVNNTALSDAVTVYKDHWRDHITEDGCYREFGGYAMARAGDPSRYNKGVFHDVIVYAGIDPTWYSDPKMSKFYEWLGGYALMPNRYNWPLGDGSYAPFTATYASPFDRAGNFSTLGLAYGEWQQNGAIPPAKLFSYLARARATGTATALEPPSRIFNNGAAYLRQKDGGTQSLAAVLTNQKFTTVPNLGHLHRNTNSLSIAGFGEILLRGPGYNGYAAAATDPNNFGFDFSYLNNHAISQNVALFNYSIGNYQNPSFTNDHRAKHGGYGVQGLLSDSLDYATGDSGLLTDANRTINNGRHIRHTVAIYPQDGINGYVYAMDELEGNSSATTGQLAWHPYSDTITFNSDNSSNDRYEWQIRQKANTTDQLYLSIFMPTAPNSKTQYDGLFADDIQGSASTSFVGKYIFNGYTLNSTTKKKNVLTMFFPRKSALAVPAMERIAASGTGTAAQAAAFAFAGGVTDFAIESDGTGERTITSSAYDPAGAAARGKAVIYRKIATENSTDLAFYFVAKGRSFKNTPTGHTHGFTSDADVDLHVRGAKGTIVSPGTSVTFHHPGIFTVKLDGTTLVPLQSGNGFSQVSIPAGTHGFTFESVLQTGNTLLGYAAPDGTSVKINPANPANLFTNPGFESGAASPWVFTNTDRVTISTGVARTGSSSVSIVGGTGGAGMTNIVTLKRNIPYQFSAWALESTSNTNSYVTIYSAATPDPTGYFTGTTPVWQKVNIPFTPVNGTGTTRNVQFTPWFSSGSAGSVNFDDFELYELMAPGTSAELGTRFQSQRHTRITALRVWHPAEGPASYTLNLWDDAGLRVAQVTQAAPLGAGWVEAPLAVPVDILPGRVHTVSYGVSAGAAYQMSGLPTSPGSPIIRTVNGGNGVHGPIENNFPVQGTNGTNYWADIAYEFIPSPPAAADAVIATFTDGEGFTGPQQFPGTAGDGWSSGWVNSAGASGTGPVVNPLDNTGPYLKVTRSLATSEQHGIYRQWSSVIRPVDAFFRLTFDVRLDSDSAVFNSAGDNLTIAGSTAAGAGTSVNSTFFIRAFGAASGSLEPREWGVFNGQPGVANTYDPNLLRPTGMLIQPGTTYHFTIDVYAATGSGTTAGKTHGTYDVSISDGASTVKVTGSGFRANTFQAGNFLSFTTQQSLATDNLAFSLDSIRIDPLQLAPPQTPSEIWQAAHFTPAELANSALEASLWGMLADPDGDGSVNLLEYALAKNPRVSDTTGVRLGTAMRNNGEGGEPYPILTLAFFRARADLTYLVEGSYDLSNWLTIAENPPALNSEVTVDDSDPIDGTRRFLRLRVIKP